MNQAMQSFLLKTICCILIINVTICSSCFRSVCKARCYFKHSGFDFGYCEKGICKCVPPVIYVFDGIGRDLSDRYIDNSLVNNNIIQNSIPISRPPTSNISDGNKKNKKKKNDAGNLNSKNSPVLNGVSNQLPPQGAISSTKESPKIATSPQETPKTQNKLTASSPRHAVPNKNSGTNILPVNSITGANSNVQQNNNLNNNKLQPKLKTKRRPNQEDDKNEEIVLELEEETYEDEDSGEESDENITQNSSVKPHTPNDKVSKNLPAPVRNENLDDDSSYESGSGSYESVEEDNANEVVNAVVK